MKSCVCVFHVDYYDNKIMQESPFDLEHVKTPEPDVYWLPKFDLTFDDQQVLSGGRWLSSKHIYAVHTLLKKQYPEQNGLQDTLQLSNNFKWLSGNKDFVQIIHISQNHWVCASNRLTPDGVVEVYDSLPATCNNTLTGQIAAILRCSTPHFTIRWASVQLQSGKDDCALFAVAFAEALCAGKDPHTLCFNQSLMRHHLLLCFERGAISQYPESDSTQQRRMCRSRMTMYRKVYVYCSCRLPWDKQGDMVQCVSCKEWFHQVCLNIPDAVFLDPLSVWTCNDCEERM